MDNLNLLNIIKERIKTFFILIKEGYRLKDKIIIFRYYLKSPLHFFNYIIGKKNKRDLSGNVFIKNHYGIFFCGNNFSSVYGSSSIGEEDIRKEVSLAKGIVMDIGANCGMFTIPLAKMLGNNGKVISIEAEKKNVRLLKKNVELNKLKNVFIVGKGVFSKKGKLNLNIDEYGTGGHSIQKTKISEFVKKQIIEVDTIDNILKELNIKKIDLIKIDIEGGELDAFKGAEKTFKNSHPKIIFEALENNEKEKIVDFLSKYKYKIRPLTNIDYIAE